MRQVCETWRSRLCDLYWVSTTIWRRPGVDQVRQREVDRGGSCPPNGTAGLARSAVSGMSRLPSPPARTMPKIFLRRHGSNPRQRDTSSAASCRCAALALPHARRPAHPGVSARGLRRCRRARRRARPGPPRPTSTCVVRCFGARPRRAGRHRVSRARRARPTRTRRSPRSGVDLQIAQDVAGADLVHSHTWYANGAGHIAQAAARHPARRHRAQPRAAAPVEGRAARRRLPGLELDRDARRSRAPTRSSR